VKELRKLPEYVQLTSAAEEDGAEVMATLLRHVGWNRPDGSLTIYESTSGVGRDAFAAIGFTEHGPTGVPIHEVLTRAARWSAVHGFPQLSNHLATFIDEMWPTVNAFAGPASEDAVAEASAVDESEVDALGAQLAEGNFAVSDQHVTAKTRGSAQRAFADSVKRSYGWKCALTGIATREFLVASHIVPWSADESIRLDPANGICLSTFVDRAFDTGYLEIREDCSIHVDWNRVGADDALRDLLERYDGRRLTLPMASPPNPAFLRRRIDE